MAGSMRRGGSARRTPDGHAGVRKHQGHCYLNNNKSASAGHTWRGASLWLRILIVWISLMSCTCTASSTSATEPPGRQEKVCKDIDIRNRVNFSKLENCTVIEGSLQILLIDYADPSEYENLHFPKLLEITDYLLLYRVYGLKTLAHIFPNLAVIRGQKLFFNYALVAFEMPDIEELGLAGLTHIVRGAVRLEKNAKLCYVHTIDWSRIARNVSREDHFISQNKDQNECVDVCPRKDNGEDRCERLPVPNEDGINRTRAVCWTANHCQKVCKPKCESGCYQSPITHMSECCNEHCIGGCTGPAATQCFACKDVLGISGRCQPRCTGTFKYMNRRCILRRDCENLKTRGAMYSQVQWKLHQNECIKDCPSGYMDMEGNNRCKKCPGPCPKVCMAKVVDSVATAQELKGCTVIEGILEIQIRGGNRVMQELEESLGLIQRIPALKIVGSMAIDSLRFLRSLQVIDGETLFSDRFSLFVLDNQNLQEIWDLKTHPKLTLLQGSLFFHRNHKLCYYKIQDFVQSLELDLASQDISPVTNGDQMPCNISQITIHITQVKVTFAVVKWTAYEMNDPRQLLSYVIYYKESPYKNQTIFNAKDSCGLEDWQTFDVRPVPGQVNLAELVYDLKPWTQYAMYIQTYTLSSTSEGGVSPIIYFTTLPTTPTHPRDVQVKAISPNELRVTWLPPNKPNGNVTHYQVYWQPQPLNREKLDRRNYCTDKLHLGWKTRKSEVEMKKEEERNTTQPSNCCKCPKTEEEKKQEEEERRMEIEFQNFLQDTVYVKRPPKNGKPETESDGSQMQVGRRRRRRSIQSSKDVQKLMQNLQNMGLNESYWPEGLNISSLSNMSMVNNTEGSDEEHVPYVAAVVYGKTEMILPNLKHFQEYSIEVIACHDPQVNDKTEKQCSNRAITTGRTLDKSDADYIEPQNVSVQVEPDGRVSIRWADPVQPNGLIVTYEIEYGKVSQENYKLDVLCIPHLEYRKSNGYTMGSSKRLQPGNYSYRIRATSLAGNGTWTPKFYFFLHDRYDESFGNTLVIIIPVVVVVVFLMIFLGGMYFVYKKRLAQNLPDGVLYASVNPHYMSPDDVYVPDKWEVPRDKIKLLRELGQGSFGMVHEGIASELIKDVPSTKVAVKTVNENATIRDRIEFLQEASVMKAFNCNHVVKLLGVVSKGQPTMVIMELMASGDLKNFLRMHRPTEDDNDGRKPPTLKQILQMSGEIADGMAYLSAMKFVHRDLAARNCMVSEDIIVKVGDFGMTRDIYETDYYRKGGKGLLPVRWMAPESLKDGIFTSQSDVWSFGVVLWEMATLAFQPYQGLANEQVLKYVIDGGVMQQPYGCPERLYNMMLLCWRHNAKQRPTFINIVESLAADLNEDFRKKSYFYSEERKEKEREQEEKERENAEKERENAEIEQAEAAAMAAAKANAIGPEEFESFNDEEEDITTPLTGSPRYSSQELDDLEADHRQSLESVCSQCSHRRPCECIDIDNAKSKPGLSSGSPLRRLYMGTVPPDVPTNSGDHRVGVGPPPVTSSSEGSKESTKSSGSSHLHLNGISNGHLPRAYLAQHKYAEC